MAFKPDSDSPDFDDPICLPSYVIASARVGGGPADRRGFWPAYWEALDFNERHGYENSRVAIVKPLIVEMLKRNPGLDDAEFYYRDGRLLREDEKTVEDTF